MSTMDFARQFSLGFYSYTLGVLCVGWALRGIVSHYRRECYNPKHDSHIDLVATVKDAVQRSNGQDPAMNILLNWLYRK